MLFSLKCIGAESDLIPAPHTAAEMLHVNSLGDLNTKQSPCNQAMMFMSK